MSETQVCTISKKQWKWSAGVWGGLAGGVVFGIMMGMMGMLTTIAGMMGSHSALVGFAIHMMISIVFGLGFVLFSRLFRFHEGISGILYGIVLWFLFPFVLMPLMMGMGQPFQFTTASMLSLVGHMMFGAITGLVYKWIH